MRERSEIMAMMEQAILLFMGLWGQYPYFVRAASQISQSLGNIKKQFLMKQSRKHGNRLHFPITIKDSDIH